jgi:hypothetical protein
MVSIITGDSYILFSLALFGREALYYYTYRVLGCSVEHCSTNSLSNHLKELSKPIKTPRLASKIYHNGQHLVRKRPKTLKTFPPGHG